MKNKEWISQLREIVEHNPPTIYPREFVMPIDKEFIIRKIDKGPHTGEYRVIIDKENNWGPIMSKKRAEEMKSRFLNSDRSFEEFVEEWL